MQKLLPCLLLVFLSNCDKEIPPVTTCVLDPDSNGSWCVPVRKPDTDPVLKSYDGMANFICVSPQDYAIILQTFKKP